MMVDSTSFVTEIIAPTLQTMCDRLEAPGRFNGLNAVKLLTMIAAHESHFQHRRQIDGPALSYFQIEPNTLDDLCTNYLSYRPESQVLVDSFLQRSPEEVDKYEQLENNDEYATCIARLILWRVVQPLPDYDDEEALSQYAKQHWNTPAGAATPKKYYDDFKLLGPSSEFWQKLKQG